VRIELSLIELLANADVEHAGQHRIDPILVVPMGINFTPDGTFTRTT
jgi:hypothetical protein